MLLVWRELPTHRRLPGEIKKCSNCGKLGQYEKVCRSMKSQAAAQEPMFRRKKQTKASNDDDDSYDEYIFSAHDGRNQAQPWTTVNMCGTDIRMLVDTGSTVNIIDSQTYQMMQRTSMLRKPGHTNIYIYMHTTHLTLTHTHSCSHTFTQTLTHTHSYTHVHTHTNSHPLTYSHTLTLIHSYIHSHIHTHSHTQTHTHTH